jgi:Helix-turn-helix of DDE superfamily endonuclease
MDYFTFSKNEKQFIALTSLTVLEFEGLLLHFAPHCEQYFRRYTLEGSHRKHIRRAEHGNAVLRGSEQKLFFLLVYMKSNVLQAYQAASFGISQSKVSRIYRVLLGLLNQVLDKLGLLPIRDSTQLVELLKDHPTKVFCFDATERNIQRNSDYEIQEEEFSGKKKRIM